MTPEEALKRIKRTPVTDCVGYNDFVNTIISALEKQIPKKAEHDEGVWSICPNCGGSVCNDSEEAVNGKVSYCDHCGQALLWEVE